MILNCIGKKTPSGATQTKSKKRAYFIKSTLQGVGVFSKLRYMFGLTPSDYIGLPPFGRCGRAHPHPLQSSIKQPLIYFNT